MTPVPKRSRKEIEEIVLAVSRYCAARGLGSDDCVAILHQKHCIPVTQYRARKALWATLGLPPPRLPSMSERARSHGRRKCTGGPRQPDLFSLLETQPDETNRTRRDLDTNENANRQNAPLAR